jgi:hypothetical protein
VGDTPESLDWPTLPFEAWRPTRDTLHMWTQIVGKLRLALSTPLNHWWHVPLYLTARGLTTSPIPCGNQELQIDFDFHEHELVIGMTDGRRAALDLPGQSVASFYNDVMATLAGLDVEVRIWPVPVEVPDPIPFQRDDVHATYDPEHAHRFFRVLLAAGRALERKRSGFVGKSSPVQFFWGSFDLALSLYSGRRAPDHPGIPGMPLRILREAYSHEEAAFGFWPGDARFPEAIFYAYAYPEPPGYRDAPVRPEGAVWNGALGEFLLPYERVRRAARPAEAVAAFLDSTYEAAAELGRWDRAALERPAPFDETKK